MVAKRLTTDAVDADFVDTASEDISALADEQQREADEILSAFGADEMDVIWDYKVLRIQPNTNKREHCFAGTRADAAGIIERCKEEYGPGDYEVYIKRNSRLYKKPSFSIAKTLITAPVRSGEQSSGVVEAIRTQSTLLAQLVERVSTPPTPPPPPQTQWTVPNIIAVVAALGGVDGIKSLFGIGTNNAPANQFEMLRQVMELVKDMQPESDGTRERGMMDVLGDLLKSPLMDAVATQVKQVNLQPPLQQPLLAGPMRTVTDPATGRVYQVPLTQQVRPQVTQTTPQQTAPAPASPSPVEQAYDATDNEKRLRDLLDMLIRAANKGSDPTLYADFLLDQDELTPFIPALLAPDALPALSMFDARISQHVEWFTALLDAVRDPTAGDDETNATVDRDELADNSVSDTGPDTRAEHIPQTIPAPV